MQQKKTGRGRIDVIAPPEWIDALAALADRQGQSLSALIRSALTDFMRGRGVEPPSAGFAQPREPQPKRPRGRPRKTAE